jgi:hypothetical protein
MRCRFCYWFPRCSILVSTSPDRADCDWIPSRFFEIGYTQERLAEFLAERSHDKGMGSRQDLQNSFIIGVSV